MTIAVDLGRKATKQTYAGLYVCFIIERNRMFVPFCTVSQSEGFFKHLKIPQKGGGNNRRKVRMCLPYLYISRPFV